MLLNLLQIPRRIPTHHSAYDGGAIPSYNKQALVTEAFSVVQSVTCIVYLVAECSLSRLGVAYCWYKVFEG